MKGISVIIPYYCGNKYMKRMADVLKKNIEIFEENFSDKIEVIFVNDSPWDKINTEYLEKLEGYYQIIENEVNCGIHKARINGINKAETEYVLMLDQDDEISNDWMKSQYLAISSSNEDILIANGIRQGKSQNYPIFKNEKWHKMATTIWPYIAIGNVIASPGQCLIRKAAIPNFWMENVLEENCADDMYLWLLMFAEEKNVGYNAEILYTHVSTGENFSLNEEKTILSEKRVIELLRKHGKIKEKYLVFYEKRLNMRKKYLFDIKCKALAKMYYFTCEIYKRARLWMWYYLS